MKQTKASTLKQVLHYAQPYKSKIFWVIVSVITLSIFAALRPYMVKNVVDVYIDTKDIPGLIFYVILMAVVLILEVGSPVLFTYIATWLGLSIITDIRTVLFHLVITFCLRYCGSSLFLLLFPSIRAV